MNIALIAHDAMKPKISEWVKTNQKKLKKHKLFTTKTTGTCIEKETGLKVTKVKSGPWGGDQQIGAKIVEGKIDVLIFLCDPHSPQPHDVDVKALLRIAVVYNIPTACNLETANLILKSL